MARIEPIADADPAAALASMRRGIAMLATRPIIPQTKIKSISAKPCAWRILKKQALLSASPPELQSSCHADTDPHFYYLQQFIAVALTGGLTLYVIPRRT